MGSNPNVEISISGTVYRKEGDARRELHGATVVAENHEGTTISAQTEEDGKYELKGLKTGPWRILAWHEDYATPKPIVADFDENTQGQDFELSAGIAGFIQVAGTVYWRHTNERVHGALVKATLKTEDASGKEFKHTWTDDGDFSFDALQPGKWSFMVLHEKGRPSHKEETFFQGEAGFRLDLSRQMGDHDKKVGPRFFTGLCIALGLLAVLYMALHVIFPTTGEPVSDVLVSLVDQAKEQVAEAQAKEPGAGAQRQPIAQSTELVATVSHIKSSWNVISNTTQAFSTQDKQLVSAVVTKVEESIKNDKAQDAVAQLNTLRHLIELPAQGFFWSEEPWRFLEVLLWGLAGILVSLIIACGGYLRWRRFYSEGIPMHVSHIVTIPLMALVFVLLLSQVTFNVTLGGSNDVRIALSDPRILAAVSFLIGSRPWAIWGFIQETAGKLTGQED